MLVILPYRIKLESKLLLVINTCISFLPLVREQMWQLKTNKQWLFPVAQAACWLLAQQTVPGGGPGCTIIRPYSPLWSLFVLLEIMLLQCAIKELPFSPMLQVLKCLSPTMWLFSHDSPDTTAVADVRTLIKVITAAQSDLARLFCLLD